MVLIELGEFAASLLLVRQTAKQNDYLNDVF